MEFSFRVLGNSLELEALVVWLEDIQRQSKTGNRFGSWRWGGHCEEEEPGAVALRSSEGRHCYTDLGLLHGCPQTLRHPPASALLALKGVRPRPAPATFLSFVSTQFLARNSQHSLALAGCKVEFGVQQPWMYVD